LLITVLAEGTFTSVFKGNKSLKRSHETLEIKVFLNFIACKNLRILNTDYKHLDQSGIKLHYQQIIKEQDKNIAGTGT
jgi:hypothetical protein